MTLSPELTISHSSAAPITESDYADFVPVWTESTGSLAHAAAPSLICKEAQRRSLQAWKLYDNQERLIAYFPYETKTFVGITIIRAAFFELTLDFIDIICADRFREQACVEFMKWMKSAKNTFFDLFAEAESSELARACIADADIVVKPYGLYRYLDIPSSLEEFLNQLSKSTKRSTLRAIKACRDDFEFEIVDVTHHANEREQAIEDLFNLHLCTFPTGSMLMPHREELTHVVRNSFDAGNLFFSRAREKATGDIVAIEMMFRSENLVGTYQRGRKTGDAYKSIGNWLLMQTIGWCAENHISRVELFLGDQEWKRRITSGAQDAVRIEYATSPRAHKTYRIMQRLGRRIASLR